MKRRFFCMLLVLTLLPIPTPAAGDAVTRGDFLLLLWAVHGGVPFDKTAHPFTDLEGREDLSQAVAWAYDLGLTKGVGRDLFAPDRPLTREECAHFLRRSDSLLGRDTFLPDGAAGCNENWDISPWSDDSLYWACITGRMNWRDGRLAPLAPVAPPELEDYFSLELELYPNALTCLSSI